MIKFENTEILGWEAAIRGMRNPLNSWEKGDSGWKGTYDYDEYVNAIDFNPEWDTIKVIGPNDYDLMKRLRNAGTDHRKFMRMLTVYVDITAPLYWWKEFDTYKVGTVANSCSTMHKIADKKFTLEDFSDEWLVVSGTEVLMETVTLLNKLRDAYNNYDDWNNDGFPKPSKKTIWYNMIQLLPSSYNQKRTVMLNYEVLANIYKSRKGHKLDEWSVGFMEWIDRLPYSEFITGQFEE